MSNIKNNTNNAFTLIEMMFALTIGGMVLGLIAVMLVQGMRIWQDYTGQWLLCQQSRIAREKLLHGTFGAGGLRDANTNKLAEYSYYGKRVFTYSNAADSNHYYTVWISSDGNMICSRIPNGHGFCSGCNLSTADYQLNSKEKLNCQILSFFISNKVVHCRYKMSFPTQTRTYNQISEITTKIINN